VRTVILGIRDHGLGIGARLWALEPGATETSRSERQNPKADRD
jgi:hypothetical protein